LAHYFCFWAGDEHAGSHGEFDPPERRLAGDVLQRFARGSPGNRLVVGRRIVVVHIPPDDDEPLDLTAIHLQRVGQEDLRVHAG
jgi:hypothetical protein